MALRQRGEYSYGDAQADIRTYLLEYSDANAYVAEHFADAKCNCSGGRFRLLVDENVGAAVRICAVCRHEHPIGDSEDYLEEADLEEAECLCGTEEFEITVGVALYRESEDVKWLYLGLRCPKCRLVGCYGDWKNEYENYRELLSRV
ncbi:MAG: hypothetical protein ACK47B_28825 [Armatimonadota bacterium]